MSDVQGEKSGRKYRRNLKEVNGKTVRTFTDDSGKEISDEDFKAQEGGFRESAGNTVGSGKDLSGTMRASSVSGSGMVRVKPEAAPVIRTEAPTGIAARIAQMKAEKGKATPTPEPKKKKIPGSEQKKALTEGS